MTKIKIIIADDHPIFRKGLIDIISSENSFEISGEASNGIEALEFIKTRKPDIAILDINMPEMNGFQAAENIRKLDPDIKIIFLTMHKEESIFNRALDLGVKGYVLKESALENIIECLKKVAEGKNYISPEVSDLIMKRGFTEQKEINSNFEQLTPAEKTILKLISEKKTSQQIADKLFISLRTVENHRSNICKKLGLQGINSLLKYALENKELF